MVWTMNSVQGLYYGDKYCYCYCYVTTTICRCCEIEVSKRPCIGRLWFSVHAFTFIPVWLRWFEYGDSGWLCDNVELIDGAIASTPTIPSVCINLESVDLDKRCMHYMAWWWLAEGIQIGMGQVGLALAYNLRDLRNKCAEESRWHAI